MLTNLVTTSMRAWVAALAFACFGVGLVCLALLAVLPHGSWMLVVLAVGVPLSVGTHAVLALKFLQSAQRIEALEALAFRDTLTNVATRHFFFERMEMTPQSKGAVLMVDIDHFKRVNDSHGHLMGDEVIRIVAQTLTTLCRGQDLVCRFGGEEFAIFIYDVDLETALGIAEILRESVAYERIEHGEAETNVTVSIGLALKANTDDIHGAIAAADAALYSAKQSGRNRVAAASDGDAEQGDKKRVANAL